MRYSSAPLYAPVANKLPVLFVDRVEAALRALFMAPLATFEGMPGCNVGKDIFTGATPSCIAIECMENKLKIVPRGQLGERLRRIQHRIENGPAPVHLVADQVCGWGCNRLSRSNAAQGYRHYFHLGAEG